MASSHCAKEAVSEAKEQMNLLDVGARKPKNITGADDDQLQDMSIQTPQNEPARQQLNTSGIGIFDKRTEQSSDMVTLGHA
jgi:hypothetical protein